MKYTIELTENQKKQMDFMLYMANKHMGFNRKLEMIETTNVEDTTEYQIGYKVGFKDGKLWTINENAKDHQEYYDKGYNKALEDESEFMAYMTQDFIDNCYPNDKGYNLYDLNAKYGLARVLKDYKAYKEKKKAEIKVGDEVETEGKYKAIVTYIYDRKMADILFKDGSTGKREIKSLSKTGQNFNSEMEQLFDKLRGKDNDNN